MTAPVFVAERRQLAEDRVVLRGAEGRHAATVRRLRPGEHVTLTDGFGLAAACVVSRTGRDYVEFEVHHRREEAPPSPALIVVQALAKGERSERAVEAMTEVGVDRIVPWAASRSVVRWDSGRTAKALVRWRATAREAAKQARRSWFPEITDLASTADVAGLLAAVDVAVLLHEDAGDGISALRFPERGAVCLVVGPEGGITDAEREILVAAGAFAARLGRTILRTSTAGTAAAAVVLSRSGRW